VITWARTNLDPAVLSVAAWNRAIRRTFVSRYSLRQAQPFQMLGVHDPDSFVFLFRCQTGLSRQPHSLPPPMQIDVLHRVVVSPSNLHLLKTLGYSLTTCSRRRSVRIAQSVPNLNPFCATSSVQNAPIVVLAD
jgi:hypothetical protein